MESHAFIGKKVTEGRGSDETEDLVFVPDVVVEPVTTEEVSRVLSRVPT